MTEEVTQPIEKRDEMYFLDLDERQFGTLIFLSSAAANMQEMIGGDQVRQEMKRMIESGDYSTVQTAISWLRSQRGLINQLNSASSFALNLVGQVEDRVVDKVLEVVVAQAAATVISE